MNASLKLATDFELIDEFKKGNQRVFGELYERYCSMVYKRCLQLCKDDEVALDLCQEVMLKAFEHLKEFRGDSLFKTWIYTIASRHCYSYLNKHKTNQTISDQFAESVPDRDDEDQHAMMLILINRLPDDERELLLKKYENGTSIEDLQQELNLSASAIKMRLKRSREKLNIVYSLSLTFGLDYAINMLELM